MAKTIKGLEIELTNKIRARAQPYLKHLNHVGMYVGIRDDKQNAMLGAIHNFGTFGFPNIPARPWLDAMLDDVPTITKSHAQDMRKYLSRITEIRGHPEVPFRDAEKFAAGIAKKMYDHVMQTIKAGIAPELKPATVARKAGLGEPSTPLVATGSFVDAIDYGVWKDD